MEMINDEEDLQEWIERKTQEAIHTVHSFFVDIQNLSETEINDMYWDIIHVAIWHSPSLSKVLNQAPKQFVDVNRLYSRNKTMKEHTDTALLMTVKDVNNNESLKLLLDHPDMKLDTVIGDLNNSPLIEAFRDKNEEAVYMLIEYIRHHGDKTLLKTLLNRHYPNKGSALVYVVSFKIAKLCIDYGADCDQHFEDVSQCLKITLHRFLRARPLNKTHDHPEIIAMRKLFYDNTKLHEAFKSCEGFPIVDSPPFGSVVGFTNKLNIQFRNWYIPKLLAISLINHFRKRDRKREAVIPVELIRMLFTQHYTFKTYICGT